MNSLRKAKRKMKGETARLLEKEMRIGDSSKSDLETLASKMGVNKSTFWEHLKRAEKKI